MTQISEKLSTALGDRYRIERRLGEGGMATVYLAHDVKHDRKVAIKVLRPELAAVLGAERFVQEIKTTANLQHPNILPLHDSGDADGFLYYVMPYIRGETLRDKLNREKQLGIDEAVKITTEVADALDYAHRQDVIHRDIKPENILLHDGRPMVADFGIALAVSAAAGGRMTETGLSLGTPHYMSPEQATAEKEITPRSDIYSLGAVLYEMLAGDPPHTGSTARQIIMKILTDEPVPVTKARKSVPPNVAAVVTKALEKLPADRLASAKAFGDALRDPTFTHSGERASPVVARPAAMSWSVIWTIGVMVALAIVAIVGWMRPLSRASQPVLRYSIPVPGGITMTFGLATDFALSPDGQALTYYGDGVLWLRRLDRDTATVLFAGYAMSPFFSPEGDWIGFLRQNRLWKVPATGGAPLPLAGDHTVWCCPIWFRDEIVFSQAELWSVPAEGGSARQITFPADSAKETLHSWAQVLPDGRLLYTITGPSLGWAEALIVVHDLETGERITVVEEATAGRYARSGHLLYVRENGVLYAVPFDLRTTRVTGSAVPVVEDVQLGEDNGTAAYALSESGTLAFVRRTTDSSRILEWRNRSGQVIGRLGAPMALDTPELSPDGSRLAVTIRQPNNDDIWILNASGGAPQRFTFDAVEDETPVWSPSGDRIAYSAYVRANERHVMIKAINSPAERVVYAGHAHYHVRSWSPDGRWLAIEFTRPTSGLDIGFVEVGDTAQMVTYATISNESVARFSPNGQWVAYQSDENEGRSEIFVVSWPALTGKRQISRSGGTNPRWAADGSAIYYWSIDDRGAHLKMVSVSTANELAHGDEHELFTAPSRSIWAGYDIARDESRFLITIPNPNAAAREIHIVHNLFEELKARAPS